MQRFYLYSFTTALSLSLPCVNAAIPMHLREASLNDVQQTFELVLPNLAKKMAVSQSTDSLKFVQQHTDENKITHLRMQQQYQGFPVFGGYAIFHKPHAIKSLLSTTDNVKMNGIIYRDLKTELGQPPAGFIKQGATALQRIKSNYPAHLIAEEQITPLIYIDEQYHAVWAYKVSFLVEHEDSMPERPTALVDAKTLRPLKQWNDVKTLRSSVSGQGFGGNAHVGEYQFGNERPLLSISRNNVSAICYMENKDVKVVDMAHKYSGPNNPMQFSCKQNDSLEENMFWVGYAADGYDAVNGAYSPSNDALYAGQVIHDMYQNWYGLNVLMSSEKPMQLVMRVHFGKGYENAYWDHMQMTFGDGDETMYPLVSLGIAAHEVSHGFTEQHSDLEYVDQSGGMNEAFSDMAAQTAEFYSQGQNTWTIGAEVMKEASGFAALRFLDMPSRDGRSIDRADQYRKDMNVHYSSGVYNRLFYVLANQPNWDVKRAFQVMVKANMDYWTPTSTFNEGGCGIISAAEDLGYSVDDVKQALSQVAINYKRCESA